jgi:hypothetical protein
VLKIQSGGWPLILEQDYVTKNISVWGKNISLRVIEDAKKTGCYLSVVKGVKRKTIVAKIQRSQEELFYA